jgi:hypothetical protein
MATQRFLINEHGPDASGERDGVRWLLQFAGANGHAHAGIAVPAVRSIESLRRAIGDQAADALKRHRQAIVQAGLTLEILLLSKLPFTYSGPVFVPWAADEVVDKVEAMRPAAICAMPWAESDLSVWRGSFALVDPRTNRVVTTPQELSPLITRALSDLTAFVNLGTGITHPSDKAMAVDYLKALRHGGEMLDGDQIRAWAAAHNWAPRHAQELGQLASKIANGVTVRGGRAKGKTPLNQHLARWRAKDDA